MGIYAQSSLIALRASRTAANAALWFGACGCGWLAVIGLSRPYAVVLKAAPGGPGELLSATVSFSIAAVSLFLSISAECMPPGPFRRLAFPGVGGAAYDLAARGRFRQQDASRLQATILGVPAMPSAPSSV